MRDANGLVECGGSVGAGGRNADLGRVGAVLPYSRPASIGTPNRNGGPAGDIRGPGSGSDEAPGRKSRVVTALKHFLGASLRERADCLAGRVDSLKRLALANDELEDGRDH